MVCVVEEYAVDERPFVNIINNIDEISIHIFQIWFSPIQRLHSRLALLMRFRVRLVADFDARFITFVHIQELLGHYFGEVDKLANGALKSRIRPHELISLFFGRRVLLLDKIPKVFSLLPDFTSTKDESQNFYVENI